VSLGIGDELGRRSASYARVPTLSSFLRSFHPFNGHDTCTLRLREALSINHPKHKPTIMTTTRAGPSPLSPSPLLVECFSLAYRSDSPRRCAAPDFETKEGRKNIQSLSTEGGWDDCCIQVRRLQFRCLSIGATPTACLSTATINQPTRQPAKQLLIRGAYAASDGKEGHAETDPLPRYLPPRCQLMSARRPCLARLQYVLFSRACVPLSHGRRRRRRQQQQLRRIIHTRSSGGPGQRWLNGTP
jgi:hypothetical protein